MLKSIFKRLTLAQCVDVQCRPTATVYSGAVHFNPPLYILRLCA